MQKLILSFLMLTLSGAVALGQQPWRFIITGDSRGKNNGVNSRILTELADEIVNANVDFLLFCGDLISGDYDADTDTQSELNTWLQIMQPVYDAGIAVYVIRGNHEDDPFFRDIAVWHNTFSGPYALPDNGPAGEVNLTYSVAHKNAFVVGLDEYVNDFQVNQEWLDTQLAQNTRPHVFVFGHLPAFRALPRTCLDFYSQKRDAFWQSLCDAGARTYFCSHDHFYDHARIDDGDGNADNDLHQYIIGTAGAPPYSDVIRYEGDNGQMTPVNIVRRESYGYLLAEIDDLDVMLTFMRRNTLDPYVAGTYGPDDTWSYSLAGITVLGPNGGEQIVASQDYAITWQMAGSSQVENVRLQFHDGQSWNDINDSPVPADAQSYVWSPIPAVDFDRCLIRISDWDNPVSKDISDDFFTVFQCRMTSVADLNNDCYVNMQDLVILAAEWLKCGNPFDAGCSAD